MVIHIHEAVNQLVILNRRGHRAGDLGTGPDADTCFQTGLPEERQFLELHTEEDGHLSKTTDELILHFCEVIGIGHCRRVRLHTERTKDRTVRLVRDAHNRVIGIELCADGHEELLVAQLVPQTETSADEAFVFVLETGLRLVVKSDS